MTGPAFVPAGPLSVKLACSACGTRGYPGGSWQKACRRGHTACPACGRVLTVRLDGSARVHTRCPGRLDDVPRDVTIGAMTSTPRPRATYTRDADGTALVRITRGSARPVDLTAADARQLAEELLAHADLVEQDGRDAADQHAYADSMGLGA